MIEVVLNDRLGKKVRAKCNEDDTIGDLKKLVAAQTGTRPEKIHKWYNIYKDHITLKDYEIHDGMGLELYYNQPPPLPCCQFGCVQFDTLSDCRLIRREGFVLRTDDVSIRLLAVRFLAFSTRMLQVCTYSSICFDPNYSGETNPLSWAMRTRAAKLWAIYITTY
ncbi:uncharacterized protein [Miscanthus floridulus]|uniref:uncharacterized protein n=1 Tax=Miscanthus floridulus TaxID=154761 RepID=UPI0034597266